MKKYNQLRTLITIFALGLILIHFIWPNIKIDSITLGLIVVALLPWLSTLVESLKLPGGWEITFREVEKVGNKILENNPPVEAKLQDVSAYLVIATEDPNLALVGLRIEIEKRLRKLARNLNFDSADTRSLTHLSSRLGNYGILDEPTISGLQSIVEWGNKAAHGASADKKIADWAIKEGQNILAVLDSKLRETVAKE